MKLHPETFRFLKDLKENNQRDWFNGHKDLFLKIKEDLETYVDALIQDFLPFEPSIQGLTGKKSVMRIYRDVRFSLDKSPYKVNFGASFHDPNRKGNFPGYFLSIGPESSFLAGGYWMPDPTILKSIRQEIDYNPEKFQSILSQRSFKEFFGELGQESKLKSSPKGYSDQHPLIEILKLRSFTASFPIGDLGLLDGKAYPIILEGLKALIPLIQFLREVGPQES
jgi:uncharacterized protein (TIGR02453 family)